jgi:hypothetical protein|tara:strand:- start:1504 stop:2388 length:885 start_codon:yes stop_codon:yes gene_type:complete
VKGVFINQFADDPIIPLLNGQYRKEFLYPRVQVKILNEQIYLVGINEGVNYLLSLKEKFNTLDFGNITFRINDINIDENSDILSPSNQPIKYRFISPWVALNPGTKKRYKNLNNSERIKYLSQLLTHNILFLGKEMGITIDTKVYTWLTLSSLFPKPVGEKNWGSFSGGFKTNFILPNYIGLGNGITRGFGTIYGFSDSDGFSFDEELLKEEPKFKEKTKKKPPPHKFKKKKGSDSQKTKEHTNSYKTKKKKNTKFKKKNHPQFVDQANDDKLDNGHNDFNFNRGKFHKKQHEF